ncbi:hypothetical protein C8J56DRAFT_292487 [Mycena floridula]|nr:hypothetical protein C8J56DRAFT_292487 [Mycena floridula]
MTIIITALITTRLLLMHRRIAKVMTNPSSYLSFSAMMMIESALIYSSNGLIFLFSYAINCPIQNLALLVLGHTRQSDNVIVRNSSMSSLERKKVHCSSSDHLPVGTGAGMVRRHDQDSRVNDTF